MRHLRSIAQLCRAISSHVRHISTIAKKLLDGNIFSTYSHNMVNFRPLAAEIVSLVWGTPANFNGFRVLASLLHRRRSPEANQTLHDLRPSPGLLHYVYIFGGSCTPTEFCELQNSLCVQVLRSNWQHYCTALEQRPWAKLCGVIQGIEVRNFLRGPHYIGGGAAITLSIGHSAHILHFSREHVTAENTKHCKVTKSQSFYGTGRVRVKAYER